MNQIDYFLSQLFQPADTTLFSAADVLLSMVVTTLLCFMLTQVYRYTHRGTCYSQSFMVTMFLMAVTTSVVMMIIGSNIARAFSLVGALSIIRFRTAMKDPRDTGYLFAAMIAGMGCGTQFYMPSIALTVFVSVLMLVVHYMDYGVKTRLESILRVTFADNEGEHAKIEQELAQVCQSHKLINRIREFGDGLVTNVYVVLPGKEVEIAEVESRLKNLGGVVRLALYETDQHAPV
jgi:uncharacterized membrane protein YhiD involved in acid resistance